MIERAVAFGAAEGLVGTLCLPAHGARTPVLGKLLFNAGVIHRVGPHRINVRLARRLAAQGIPSLRFDLAGQGDSARATSGLPFEAQAVADLRAAMDVLAGASGTQRFSIFGFCSGGVHGRAAARADARVAGLILYDTYLYRTWRARVNRYLLRIREVGLARALAGRLRAPGSQASAGAAAGDELAVFRTPTPAELAEDIRLVHARGGQVGFIVSGSFRRLHNYAEQYDDVLGPHGVRGLYTAEYLPRMGHNATVLAQQDALMAHIARWTAALEARLREAR